MSSPSGAVHLELAANDPTRKQSINPPAFETGSLLSWFPFWKEGSATTANASVACCYDSLSLRRGGPFRLSTFFCLSHFSHHPFVHFFVVSNPPTRFLSSFIAFFCLSEPPFRDPTSSFSLHSINAHFCRHLSHCLSSPTSSPSLTFPPTSSSSPTLSDCKHVFHMRSHCTEPTEQNNHA